MRERGLLKTALQSGKTMSKKQQENNSAEISSRSSSRVPSNAGSRSVSRQVSDNEDEDSDDTGMSASSFGDLRLSDPDDDDNLDSTSHDFKLLLEEIIERKGSTTQGRELALSRYIAYTSRHVESQELSAKGEALMASFMKSATRTDSEKETCLALNAIRTTYITAPPAIKDHPLKELKALTTIDHEPTIRAGAIAALSTVIIFAELEAEIQSYMDDLVEMLESDDITDKNNDDPFKAACQEWAFLATYIDDEDLEDLTELPALAFKRQLDNKDPYVQIAAGKAIALLYEKSTRERNASDDPLSQEEIEENPAIDNSYVSSFEVLDYSENADLLQQVRDLSGNSKSAHRLREKAGRELHKVFRSVLQTIEHPARGPGWRNTIDHETGRVRGHGTKVNIQNRGVMILDRWWKLHRYEELTRILGGGFMQHFEGNELVGETLP